MKPHMMHIAHTLARKQAIKEAGDKLTTYGKYKQLILRAELNGFSKDEIVDELLKERERIEHDKRWGDALFQEGLENAQESSLNAIDKLIREIGNKPE